MEVYRVLAETAKTHGDSEAVAISGKRATYSELIRRVDDLAARLATLGVKAREHVAFLLPNSLELVTAFYAIQKLDAVAVPLNTWYKGDELGHVLAHSDAVALLTRERFLDADFHRMASALAPALPQGALRRIVTFASRADAPIECLSQIEPSIVADGAESVPDEVGAILYTSGTTAEPKGVCLRKNAIVRGARAVTSRLGLTASDRYYCGLPFFHAGGLLFAMLACATAGAAVLSAERFDPGEAIELLRSERCTVTGGFETLFLKLVQHPAFAAAGITAVGRGWWVGTAENQRAVETAFGAKLSSFYGLTEATGNVCSSSLDDPEEIRRNSCGFPNPGREVSIVDEGGNPVGPDHVGEIVVGGWGAMAGYYKMPEQTAAAIDGAGRLHTGDIGCLRSDGRLVYMGRNRDVIKSGGHNIAPQEVEEIIQNVAGVDSVAVVGIPDPVRGEVPVAFVTLISGVDLSAEDITHVCRERIAKYKMPRDVIFLDALPMTGNGKVRRTELRNRYVELQRNVGRKTV